MPTLGSHPAVTSCDFDICSAPRSRRARLQQPQPFRRASRQRPSSTITPASITTSSPPTTGEIADLDTGVHPGWTRTGYRFPVIKSGSAYPGTSPVCRFFGEKISSHFYTSKPAECEDVKTKLAADWSFESGEVFRAFAVDPASGLCPADTEPVYRLWNQRPDANHRYTDQIAVFEFMVNKNYKAEGDGNPALPVVFCTPAGGDVVPPPPAALLIAR